uniref:InaF motif containing 2 n=1 Tax=Anopheles culicifacies TaxID=139723 RepID=A0A182MK39_9DIPT
MSYTAEEKIKLAGEDSKDRLYEAKQNQKAIRILTVAAYVLCVSLVAIMLSLYYIFFWDPSTNPMQQKTQTIDTLIIPDHLAIRLANRSEQGTVSDGPRLNTDEDDGSDDYEQSGNYELYSNHTTIQLDADETEQQ